MQIARVTTWAPVGLDCQEVIVEVAARPGLSSFSIVGLAGRSVAESKERIRLALRTIGVKLPATSIVVNLSPAELSKSGSHYDLPIALCLLKSIGYLKPDQLDSRVGVIGQLGLDGSLRAVPGAISFAIAAQAKKRPLIAPAEVAPEIGLVPKTQLLVAENLAELLIKLKNKNSCFVASKKVKTSAPVSQPAVILDDLLGQTFAKRVGVIALAGKHHLLLHGPPGVGKTMLTEALSSLLPPLSPTKSLAVTKIYSRAGLLNSSLPVVWEAPFRHPHHTSTVAALLGGGTVPRPGEISLAHHGILFLDELPLFSSSVLESLREPLETGQITINRQNQRLTWPANFLLIGAYNPCRCGYLGSKRGHCTCTPAEIASYQKKLSGPILDRIDLFVCLDKVERVAALAQKKGEHLTARAKIRRAKQWQWRRGQQVANGNLPVSAVKELLAKANLTTFLDTEVEALNLSLRQAFKAVRVAQTIADVDGVALGREQLEEALMLLPPASLSQFSG